MYQALYRKYRPVNFDDVCGQDHITSVLKMQLQKNRTSHAYMFCGSRGTGKTSCAKILAKAVNCENPQNGEPCNACPSCLGINEGTILDVVEMDAASNNGVDNIRRLCDEVQFLPTQVKKRVYIIDEVHMLSISAFNALLKTIEEPPEHVLFIFATTEMNDIPATIMSRCQRFDFKRLGLQTITDRIMKIAGLEGICIEREAASIIARLSDGAMRDALSLLEACQGIEGEINTEKITELLGLGSRSMVISLCRAVAEQNSARCLMLIQKLYDSMSDFKEIIGAVIGIYRDLFVLKCVPNPKDFVNAYENEFEELSSIAALLPIELLTYQSQILEEFYTSFDRISSEKKASSEILFLRLCSPALSEDPSALAARIAQLEKAPPAVSAAKPKASASANREEIKPSKKEERVSQSVQEENAPAEFQHSLKLKNLLQTEAFMKAWLPQIRFMKDGSTLCVLSGSFVKGILTSCGAEKVILARAQELDPSIANIAFTEKNDASSPRSEGLEGL